jgi:hypothetical protein
MIGSHHNLDVANATQRYLSLAILHRFCGISREQHVASVERAHRLGNRAELVRYKLYRLLFIDLASDDQDRVVRLLVATVERL